MKEVIRFATILTIVSVIAAGSLAWVNQITKPRIISQQSNQLNDALTSVLPSSEKGCMVPVKKEEEILYYKGYGRMDTTQFIGYAFIVSRKGYSSTIKTLVGMDSVGTVVSIKILYEQETPGLGTRCEEIKLGESIPWWQAQFAGTDASRLALDKDGGTIQTITGATVTSRAITDGIAKRCQSFLEQIHHSNQP